ncbi:universal stress protein [Nocardia bovistercoris]|uniref:Universal stress protein n=1 Tax=Nocardia bovistercoris TaxID=2785916 RepID=A0A931IA46_9NOCA|nr:universal stress protein [Nocardia bovistercoris]MBH0777777.1 universal stress protein [Nocardia bovistercoris]
MTSKQDDPHRLATAPIVLGVDGTPACAQAIRWAARTAARRGRLLHIVHALDLAATRALLGSYDVLVPSVVTAMHDYAEQVLVAAASLAREAAPEVTIATELTEAGPARLLIEMSKSAHLVVLGARSDVGTSRHLGSTLLKVTAHGHGAIVVVHDTDVDVRDGAPVVVGVDGSPVGEPAIAAAFAEASERAAELVAVHAWSDIDEGAFAGADYLRLPIAALEPAERTLLAERLAGWQEKYPDVRVTREVVTSGPRRILADHSATAQLLVVGSRGRGGFRGLLLGSTSAWILQRATCPVMIVHPA